VSGARDAGLNPASALAADSVSALDSTSGFTSSSGVDTSVLPSGLDQDAQGVAAGRWLGWRRRVLVVVALLGCVGLFSLLRTLAAMPYIDATWRTGANGQLILSGSSDAQLRPHFGQIVLGVVAPDGRLLPADVLQSRRSPRWTVDDAARAQQVEDGDALAQALALGTLRLRLADTATDIDVPTVPRGYAGLGSMFWLMTALALVFYLIGAVVVLVQPDERNLLYGLMALMQTAHLLLIGLDTLPALGVPAQWARLDLWLRVTCDVVTGAACVNALGVHPRRLPFHGLIAVTPWAIGIGFIATVGFNNVPGLWWWVQALQLGYFAACGVVLTWSYRAVPHPIAIVIRRLGLAMVAILVLLTATVAGSEHNPDVQRFAAGPGSLIWYVFQASVLMLVPFLSRSQQVMREFTLLAGISAVATSLDLLFVAVFALSQFASHTLALFLALGLYAGARQWMLNLLMGTTMLTTERMFESLYRIAREIETAGGDATEHFARLLRELFEPLELTHTSRGASGARVVGDGSTLLVPLPRLPAVPEEHQPRGSLVLRFARRGRRMFTRDDGRTGPQRRARPHRARPARRHRRAPADADVQGTKPRDGRLRPPHAAGSEDADAWAGRVVAPAVARQRRMEGRHRAAAGCRPWRARLVVRLRPRRQPERSAVVGVDAHAARADQQRDRACARHPGHRVGQLRTRPLRAEGQRRWRRPQAGELGAWPRPGRHSQTGQAARRRGALARERATRHRLRDPRPRARRAALIAR
jgi:hypothetical protein